MREEYAALSTDSPPSRPSTWQLRFGKMSGSHSRQNRKTDEAEVRPSRGIEARSPSVSEKLLRAFDSKPNEQEELSRECVDVLIGRRNAFRSEPELRLRTLATDPDVENNFVRDEVYHDDVAAEAKEILRVRFQIESKADALRRTQGRQKLQRRQTEDKSPPRIQSRTGTTASTSARLNHTTPWNYESRGYLNQRGSDNRDTGQRATKEKPHQRQSLERRQHGSAVSISSKKPLSFPPQQLPMEHRQQLRQQARETRRIKAADELAVLTFHETTRPDNNKEEMLEQRRIEEQIERLTLENQQVAVLDERLRHRRERSESLSRTFDAWNRYVEYKRAQETRVSAEFNWRRTKCVMTGWKRYTHRRRQARAAEQARLELVREQQLNEKAKQFNRSRRLPSWFYRWTTFVTQQKDHRVAEAEAERRKTQTARLMERLQRQKTHADTSQYDSDEEEESEDVPSTGVNECYQEISIEDAPAIRERTCNHNKTSVKIHQRRSRQNAWPSAKECQSSSSVSNRQATPKSPMQVPPLSQPPEPTFVRTTKRVDKVYKAMEQRAVERKQRREELKRRYEELEQKKREEQEEQRAARESLLLQQRMEEKARIRERKVAEALALKEKQDRRNHMIAQRHKANKHNRQRLLFYYALLPWRKHHALNERVARNATRWNELRSVYLHWERWQDFVHLCRRSRRRRERAQLEEAAKHHARSLQRRALRGLTRHHQATEARSLAVRRQNQWNALQRSWAYWCKRLANERAYRQKVVFAVAAELQQAKLRRICEQWRRVTCEAKTQRELEREKEQLWCKVREWLDEDEQRDFDHRKAT